MYWTLPAVEDCAAGVGAGVGYGKTSEARAGRFELIGYAGNAAPDHVDQLHALPELLRRLWK